MIGNGLTDPLTQYASIPEYACNGPFPVFDDPEGPQCQALRSKVRYHHHSPGTVVLDWFVF